MTLQETLTRDMKAAMKAKDKVRLQTVRLLLADIKNQTIARGKPLTADDDIALLSKHAKQRREAIDAYRAGGRDELADVEAAELQVITGYLPKQLDADEVRALTAEIIAEVGATSRRDMGKVMGRLMPKVKGRFPGKEVKGIVEGLLDG